MDQEPDGYGEPGGPRRSPLPTVALWVCVGILVLAILGAAWLQATTLSP